MKIDSRLVLLAVLGAGVIALGWTWLTSEDPEEVTVETEAALETTTTSSASTTAAYEEPEAAAVTTATTAPATTVPATT
ncbi:MAG: hypothetical protein OXN80_06770, partial [bacterium]|nr:hypothetical protein [bacterium]